MLVEYHPVHHVSFDTSPPAPPPPTIAFIQSEGNNNTAANSLSQAFDANVTSGNLIVVAFGSAVLYSGEPVTITDSQSNAYTQIGSYQVNTSSTYGIGVWYTVTHTTGACTVSMNRTNPENFNRLLIHEFAGVTALDQTAQATGAGYPLDSGAMITTAANELIFGWGASDNGVTTPGTGFTIGRTQTLESTEYQIVSAAGTYHATFPGDNGSSSWACIGATFK